ncbi:ABC transporter permease [Cellulomonas uda]|uniref:Membrane protein n=1 Tax=Cellulomonas uda TaxID=1714 RepID=A0A4Y3KD51_CELUD|nr:FtsX-like permease family protein [Cellulomonas uda]NII66301.1 hypothetical protein [Cellulomonas uda]GEA81897.1 membrane protein [Cellulomonas uda]
MRRGRSSWRSDLVLGVRMSVTGGRSGWARLALVATGVGIGVAMLLLVASVPTVLDMRVTRDAARSPGTEATVRGDDTLLVKRITSQVGDELVVGNLLQPEGERAPLPPGADRVLAPGEALLSPALLRVLRDDERGLLEGRWGQRIVGTIGDDGLVGSQELRFYLGTDQLTENTALRVTDFGRSRGVGGSDPMLMLFALVGLTGMLVPVAGFIATAVRFGGEARDRRLAAVRLVGADAATTRRIAAGETLVGGVAGVLVGGALFAALRVLGPQVVPPSLSFHGADLRPSPVLAALVVVLVPVASVLVTRSALRHVVVEPLGVVRRAATVERRLWWRVAVPAVGLALMLGPLLVGGTDAFVDAQVVVLLGMVCLLAGVALLLPWLLDLTVRHLRPGALAWDLAVRRLQHESGTAVRAVSAVVVSVASLIAVHGLLGAESGTPGYEGDRYEAVVHSDVTRPEGARLAPALADIPGVLDVETRILTRAHAVEGGDEVPVVVASCAWIIAETGVTECADGDVVVLVPDGSQAPDLGTAYVLGGAGASTWTLPTSAVTARTSDPQLVGAPASVNVTPAALGDAVVVPTGVYDDGVVTVGLDRAVPDVAEHVRTTVANLDPTADMYVNDPEAVGSMVVAIRQGLLLGTVALLVVVGASLLVTVAEQLRERRRPLAVLVAFGVRRRVLGLSVLFQVAVPVAIGLVLAVAVGIGLAVVLQSGTSTPLSIDLAGVGVTAGGAAVVVLLATATLLPLLGRVTRPAGLQGE